MFSHLYAVSLLVIVGQVEQLQGEACPEAADHLLVQLPQPNLTLSEAQVARPELPICRSQMWTETNQPVDDRTSLISDTVDAPEVPDPSLDPPTPGLLFLHPEHPILMQVSQLLQGLLQVSCSQYSLVQAHLCAQAVTLPKKFKSSHNKQKRNNGYYGPKAMSIQ